SRTDAGMAEEEIAEADRDRQSLQKGAVRALRRGCEALAEAAQRRAVEMRLDGDAVGRQRRDAAEFEEARRIAFRFGEKAQQHLLVIAPQADDPRILRRHS